MPKATAAWHAKTLTDIPNIGPAMARDLSLLGITRPAHLVGKDPLHLYHKLNEVTGVRQDSEIVQREVFGPVVSVQRFADDAQAIEWANDVSYGLAASVFTRDIGRALNAARKLQFGTVWINDHIPLVSEMPHGGYKQSGYGKDLSVYSLEDYTQIKHVMAKLD